jgi:hypothetical protein
MNRKTLIAGLVFAGLILATVLLLRSPEKGNRPAEGAPRPIAKLVDGGFDTLEVTKGKATTVLKKEGDAYKIVKPMAFPADKDAAKLAFESLTKIEFGNIVSDQKSRQGEFELGDDGLRVTVKKGDAVVADLRVGKTTNQMTMVRLEGKDEVWSTSGIFKYQFDKDTTGWRDKSITSFDEKDAEKLQVTTKNGAKIVLSKPAPRDAGPAPEWQVVESSVKVEPFDKSVASGVASQAGHLEGQRLRRRRQARGDGTRHSRADRDGEPEERQAADRSRGQEEGRRRLVRQARPTIRRSSWSRNSTSTV